MASSNNTLFSVIVVLTALVATASCNEFIVGDEAGWKLGVDYQAWAQGKDFRVGDKLVFTYLFPVHNVLRVNIDGFENCDISTSMEAYVSGNDTVVLSSPGRRWYMCGIYGHCGKGMKLALTVKPAEAEPPSPLAAMPYSSNAYKHTHTFHYLLIIMLATAIITVFV